MKQFISENINGILGTTIFHLLLIMAFLFIRIGKIREFKSENEQLLIEFTQNDQSIEDIINAQPPETEMPSLDQQTLRSIAQNLSGEFENKISTEKYEEQVMDELGIKTLHPEVPEMPDQGITMQQPEEEKKPENIQNKLVNENTVVTYDLENRWHKYIYIPAFKCKGGGTVELSIVVDQQGNVTSADIIKEKSTSDPCILGEALNSAKTAVFNASSKAPSKQTGTITYLFIPQ